MQTPRYSGLPRQYSMYKFCDKFMISLTHFPKWHFLPTYRNLVIFRSQKAAGGKPHSTAGWVVDDPTDQSTTQPTYCRWPNRPIVEFGLYSRILDQIMKEHFKNVSPYCSAWQATFWHIHGLPKSPFQTPAAPTREKVQQIMCFTIFVYFHIFFLFPYISLCGPI